MATDAIQARVLAQCLFNKDRYANMFLRVLAGAGDAFTFADINPDVVELLMFEAIAAMVHVQEGIRKRNGDLQGLDLAKRRVIWRGAIEACNEGLRNATTAIPDKTNGEKGDREHTPCSMLLASFPDPAKATNGRGALGFHWSVISPDVELEDIRAIAASNIELAKQGSGDAGFNVTPFHLIAMQRQPNLPLMRFLTRFASHFAKTAASGGWLPIHYAACYSDDEHMIEYLLQCDPSSTKKLTSRNATPLHLACMNKSQGANQVFDALFKVDSDPVRMIDSDGYTPLHIACQGDLIEPGHVVAKLLAKYKEAAAVALPNGLLAVHLAARLSTKEVLEMVVKANMEGVKVVAGAYGTAMHQAASGKNVANVEYLHSLSPALIAIKSSNGLSPLHFAAQSSNFAMLRAVFACDPLAVRVADNDGLLALNYLMDRSYKLTFEPLSDEAKSLRFLLKAYPQGTSHANNAGDTPYSLCLPARAYARRLLLLAAPALDPAELHRVNYEARRQVLFLAFSAVEAKGKETMLRRLRKQCDGAVNVVRVISSFL